MNASSATTPASDAPASSPSTGPAGTSARPPRAVIQGGVIALSTDATTPVTAVPHSHADPQQDAQVRAMHAALVMEAQALTMEAPIIQAALTDSLPGATTAASWISRASWVLNQVVTGG